MTALHNQPFLSLYALDRSNHFGRLDSRTNTNTEISNHISSRSETFIPLVIQGQFKAS